MDKSEIRQHLKQERQELTADEVKSLSRQITNNCRKIVDWTKISSVHSYLPVKANNEVNILPLLQAARQVNPDLKIATTTKSARQTYWLDNEFKPGKKVFDRFEYDLILVPLIAFDKTGYRLGYGGGFYDRFLASQKQALTIGLAYEFTHSPKLPREEHDIPLQIVVTEKKTYKFNQ